MISQFTTCPVSLLINYTSKVGATLPDRSESTFEREYFLVALTRLTGNDAARFAFFNDGPGFVVPHFKFFADALCQLALIVETAAVVIEHRNNRKYSFIPSPRSNQKSLFEIFA